MANDHSASENFLPAQYERDRQRRINHNYLSEQFSDYPEILEKIAEVVRSNEFTLGSQVDAFEQRFAQTVGGKYALGVGSGTDALFLSLKALGIGPGDEVLTTPFTFFATIGAIVTAGATPVFVDVGPDYNLDVSQLEAKITSRTKAILPVHWSGRPCELSALQTLCTRHGLYLVQDACHAIQARYQEQSLPSFGQAACYSMHPLKNLNVWGDGGVIVTNDASLAHTLSLLRNHGLASRDVCEVFAYNSRLDTLQAVVALHLLEHRLDTTTQKRRANAQALQAMLEGIPGLTFKPPCPDREEVFHLFQFCAEKRDALVSYLHTQGIDAKVHYPIPMHLQPAAAKFGYQRGDFPVAEKIAGSTLSLPVHEFITQDALEYMASTVARYYA